MVSTKSNTKGGGPRDKGSQQKAQNVKSPTIPVPAEPPAGKKVRTQGRDTFKETHTPTIISNVREITVMNTLPKQLRNIFFHLGGYHRTSISSHTSLCKYGMD